MLIQYTSVAALAIATSFFIIFDMNERSKYKFKNTIFSILLFAIGGMLRFQSIILIAPFFAMYFVYTLIVFLKNKERKNDFLNLIKNYILICFVACLIYGSNALFYKTDLYKNYLEYNSVRAELQDLAHIDYDTNKEIFDEIGWSKNDYYMFYTFNYGDENIYSKENLQKIKDYKDENGEKYNLNKDKKEIWDNLKEQLRDTNKYIVIMFFATFLLSIYTNDKCKLITIFIFITTMLLNILFIILNRTMLRVVIPEYILGIAMLMYFIKCKDEKNHKSFIAVMGFLMLFVIFFAGENYRFDYDIKDYKNYQDVINYTNQHKENTYLYTSPSLQFRYLVYPVYKMPPKGAFSNLRVLGGWDIFTQNYYDFKQRNKLDGTFLDLLKENVYLIDGDVVWSGNNYKDYKKHIITALKEHYNKNVECEKIQTFDNIYIYKLKEIN